MTIPIARSKRESPRFRPGCTVWYITSNESNYLETSVKTMLTRKCVNHIVILHTGRERPEDIGALEALDRDKISEYHKFFGEGWDVDVDQGGFDEVSARNHAIKIAEKQGDEWLVQCDADEFYTEDLDKYILTDNPANAIYFSCFHFSSLFDYVWTEECINNCLREETHDPHMRAWRNGTSGRYVKNWRLPPGAFPNSTAHCDVVFPSMTNAYNICNDCCHIHLHYLYGKATPSPTYTFKSSERLIFNEHYIENFKQFGTEELKHEIQEWEEKQKATGEEKEEPKVEEKDE